MSDDVLVVTGIVHELVRQIVPVGVCDVFDPGMDSARGVVRRFVLVGEPMACVKHEPSLVDTLQAQGIAAASFTRKDSAGGNGLQA